jgi:AcrR family transcriptional regulator
VNVSGTSDRAPARSRAATRQRILVSATSLFAARGLHAVTSHDIASEAGVAAGTFYLHFPDKQTLFREIVFGAVEELRVDLQEARASAGAGQAVVRAQAEVLVDFAERRADLVRILFGRDSETRGLGADVLDHLAEGARERLSLSKGEGQTPASIHPATAAQAIVGLWSRVLAWWVEDTARATRDEVIDTIVTFQLSGVFRSSPS